MEREAQGQHRVPRRRGRRPTPPDPAAGPVGAFADRLWRLKQEAGDPSYEEMSGRLGAAASRSSLAAAAQGRSLPSWETTWEFVRVLAVDRLGHDPVDAGKEWREHWRRARAAAETAGPGSAATGPEPPGASAAATARRATPPSETSDIEEFPPTDGTGRTGDSGEIGQGRVAPAVEPAPPRLGDRRHAPYQLAAVPVTGIAVVAAALAVLTGAVVVFVGQRTDGSDASGTGAVTASPDHDDSQFEGDVTYPDGTLVPPNSSFTKIWRIRNTGTVIWANRFLARVNEDPCHTPQAVPIPQTRPGEAVDIAVPVRTPGTPGSCKIFWKMADEQGRTLFPLKRPVFLDVRVGGP